jgi:threonine dehydrogenase-like Zn-dependent dehydrogenase
MKAIAVYPGKPSSVHLEDIAKPSVHDRPGGKGVLVRVLKVGVDATDREINDALYGNSPPGFNFLVLGHECFGIVEEVGPNVRGVKPGDYVTATVRRPGGSIYDKIGTYDMTSEEVYYERGINLLHGYLTEYFVDDEDYIVKVPPGLKHLHVLMEPMSCAAKAVQQAYEVQRRMKVWRPKIAYVLGAGQIGLLSTLILKLRGLEVYTLARSLPTTLSSEIVKGMEATYVSTTGGNRMTEVHSDKINIDWVLGNKLLLGSVNANREHFESGIRDMALGEVMFPGVIQRILTNPVKGLDNYAEMMRLLVEEKSALKVYVDVAE